MIFELRNIIGGPLKGELLLSDLAMYLGQSQWRYRGIGRLADQNYRSNKFQASEKDVLVEI